MAFEKNQATITLAINLLGTTAKDRVTGFTGMISSISFDAYGCIQAWLSPAVSKDGKMGDGTWFDVKRLDLKGSKRKMPAPRYEATLFGDEQGPEAKAPPLNA